MGRGASKVSSHTGARSDAGAACRSESLASAFAFAHLALIEKVHEEGEQTVGSSVDLVEQQHARGVLHTTLARGAPLLSRADEVRELAALLIADVVRVAASQPVEFGRVRKLG